MSRKRMTTVGKLSTARMKRSRTEIIRHILEVAGNGATRNMIKCNAFMTSRSSVSEYLSFLTDNGLLKLDENTNNHELYLTTPKGQQFLNVLEQLTHLEEDL